MTEASKLDLLNPIYAILNGVLRWIGIVLLCVVVAMAVEVLGAKLMFENVDGSRLQQRTQHEQEMYCEYTENTTLWVSPTTLFQTINHHLQQLFRAISNRLQVYKRRIYCRQQSTDWYYIEPIKNVVPRTINSC